MTRLQLCVLVSEEQELQRVGIEYSTSIMQVKKIKPYFFDDV